MDLNKMIEKEKILINKASYRQLEKKKIAKPVNATAQCRLCWKYTIQTSIWRYILCTIFISSSPLYVPTVVLILLCSFTRKQNKKKMPPSVTCFGIELLSSTPQEMKNRDWIGLLLKTGWQDQFHQHSHSYLIAMQPYTHNYVSIYVYSIIIMIKKWIR